MIRFNKEVKHFWQNGHNNWMTKFNMFTRQFVQPCCLTVFHTVYETINEFNNELLGFSCSWRNLQYCALTVSYWNCSSALRTLLNGVQLDWKYLAKFSAITSLSIGLSPSTYITCDNLLLFLNLDFQFLRNVAQVFSIRLNEGRYIK